MAQCEVCGKTPISGNNVPHSHHKTRRRWAPNVQKKTIVQDGRERTLYICTSCLRTLTKGTK